MTEATIRRMEYVFGVDLHRLFDEGLLALGDDFELQVSPKLAGTSYAAWKGRKISIPSDPVSRHRLRRCALIVHVLSLMGPPKLVQPDGR